MVVVNSSSENMGGPIYLPDFYFSSLDEYSEGGLLNLIVVSIFNFFRIPFFPYSLTHIIFSTTVCKGSSFFRSSPTLVSLVYFFFFFWHGHCDRCEVVPHIMALICVYIEHFSHTYLC